MEREQDEETGNDKGLTEVSVHYNDIKVKMMKKDSQYKANEIMDDSEIQEPIFKTSNEELGNTEFKENEWYFMQLPQVLNMIDEEKGMKI